jgi:hypothetical protein
MPRQWLHGAPAIRVCRDGDPVDETLESFY